MTSAEFDKSLFHVTNPQDIFLSGANQQSLKDLISGIQKNQKLFLISGEEGSGKMLFIKRAVQELGTKTRLIQFTSGDINYPNLIDHIGNDLEAGFSVESSLEIKEQRLAELLNMWSMQHLVLLIDESLNYQHKLVDDIFKLMDSKIQDSCNVHLLISGLPGLGKKLEKSGLSDTILSNTSSIHIERLNAEEVVSYINFHLRKLKDKGKNLFSDTALKSITHYSKGLPRLINRLCSLGLLTAKLEEQPTVTKVMIDEVLENSLLLGNECGYNSAPFEVIDDHVNKKEPVQSLSNVSSLQQKIIKDIESDLIINQSDTLEPAQIIAGKYSESNKKQTLQDLGQKPAKEDSSNKTVFISAFIMGIIFTTLVGAGLYFLQQANQGSSDNKVAIAGQTQLTSKQDLKTKKIKALLRKSEQQFQKQKLMAPEQDNAWDTYQEILALDSEHPEALAGIAKIKETYAIWAKKEIEQENFQQAAYYYRKVLEASPDDQDILQALKDIDQLKLSAQTPEVPVVRIALTDEETLRIKDRLVQAKSQFDQKKLMTPEDDSAWSSYKSILVLDSTNKEALAGINKIKEKYLLWAKHEMKRGNFEHAIFLLKKSLQISPDEPELLTLLSKIEGGGVKTPKQRSNLKDIDLYKLLDAPNGLNELLVFAARQIANKRLTKPEHDSAYKIYQLILQRFPENEKALAGVEKIKDTYALWARHETRQGNFSQAQYLYGKALEVAPSDPEIMSALWQVMKNINN